MVTYYMLGVGGWGGGDGLGWGYEQIVVNYMNLISSLRVLGSVIPNGKP